jgi:hypothetical protein
MQQMKFTWKGLVLAPLLVPFVFSLVLTSSTESRSPVLGILLLFAIGSFFSYCTTIFLFLPCLYLVSKFTTLTALLTCVLGAALGAVLYLPFSWQMFLSSGHNSGPPQGSYVEFLWRQLSDPFAWALFPGGGLLTAALYWILVNKAPRRDGQRPG